MRVPTNDGLPLRTPGVLSISDKWLTTEAHDCLPVGAAANDGRLAGCDTEAGRIGRGDDRRILRSQRPESRNPAPDPHRRSSPHPDVTHRQPCSQSPGFATVKACDLLHFTAQNCSGYRCETGWNVVDDLQQIAEATMLIVEVRIDEVGDTREDCDRSRAVRSSTIWNQIALVVGRSGCSTCRS